MAQAELTMTAAVTKMRESLDNFDAAKADRIGSPSLGDVVRQGDLYLVCIESLPKGTPSEARQLVPGTTQGSRHVAHGDCTIVNKVSFRNFPEVLVGPALHCKGDVEIDHPEHGNKVLPKGTTWQTVYQKAFAEEIRRVQD